MGVAVLLVDEGDLLFEHLEALVDGKYVVVVDAIQIHNSFKLLIIYIE